MKVCVRYFLLHLACLHLFSVKALGQQQTETEFEVVDLRQGLVDELRGLFLRALEILVPDQLLQVGV